MWVDRLKNSGELLLGFTIAIFASVAVVHGFDHVVRLEVILAVLALSLAFFGLHLLTPRRFIEGREKAARLGQIHKLKPAEIAFMVAASCAFGLAVYAIGLI